MPIARRGETALHFIVSGRRHGEQLLLLHALGASAQIWVPQLAALERHFRVIRYDLRGHGASPPLAGEPAACTIADLADDALAVLDAAAVDRAHWCGLSIGGMTALQAAIATPERVARLVVASAAASFPPRELWEQRIATVRAEGLGPIAEGARERWFTAAFRKRSPEIVERVLETVRATSPRGYAECCAAVRDLDLREQLAQIRAPTLVIAGAGDPANAVANADQLTEAISGADRLVLDAAHLCNMEQAEDFNEALLGFLRG